MGVWEYLIRDEIRQKIKTREYIQVSSFTETILIVLYPILQRIIILLNVQSVTKQWTQLIIDTHWMIT